MRFVRENGERGGRNPERNIPYLAGQEVGQIMPVLSACLNSQGNITWLDIAPVSVMDMNPGWLRTIKHQVRCAFWMGHCK